MPGTMYCPGSCPKRSEWRPRTIYGNATGILRTSPTSLLRLLIIENSEPNQTYHSIDEIQTRLSSLFSSAPMGQELGVEGDFKFRVSVFSSIFFTNFDFQAVWVAAPVMSKLSFSTVSKTF